MKSSEQQNGVELAIQSLTVGSVFSGRKVSAALKNAQFQIVRRRKEIIELLRPLNVNRMSDRVRRELNNIVFDIIATSAAISVFQIELSGLHLPLPRQAEVAEGLLEQADELGEAVSRLRAFYPSELLAMLATC